MSRHHAARHPETPPGRDTPPAPAREHNPHPPGTSGTGSIASLKVPAYFQTVDGERLWRADRIGALLSGAADELAGVLFVQCRAPRPEREPLDDNHLVAYRSDERVPAATQQPGGDSCLGE